MKQQMARTATIEAEAPVVGRRERKRLETRNSLVRAAIELFSERSFDAVTVTEIAERADVDPSTFFRHFGSKEAVLFTDVSDSIGQIRASLLARPADEPLLESLREMAVEHAEIVGFDAHLEVLRATLTESAPTIRAQSLVFREALTYELAQAIGERQGIDPDRDARPYLAAATWVAGFEWYRNNSLLTGKRPTSAKRAIAEVVELVGPVWVLLDHPKPAAKRARVATHTRRS
jgi:AcrR family transcriptional regulator